MVPNFDRSIVKHACQNIENDCHQWLSRSLKAATHTGELVGN